MQYARLELNAVLLGVDPNSFVAEVLLLSAVNGLFHLKNIGLSEAVLHPSNSWRSRYSPGRVFVLVFVLECFYWSVGRWFCHAFA